VFVSFSVLDDDGEDEDEGLEGCFSDIATSRETRKGITIQEVPMKTVMMV